jgi:hypothetical protein
MNLLRQVKGVSKQKLKAREYNLKRKMSICFGCSSTNHTLAKCPEKSMKHDTKVNICFPHTAETSHKSKEIPLQQIIEAYTENHDEKCQHMMLTDTEVDKVDLLLLDNLLESQGPGPKNCSFPEHSMLNAEQEKSHIIKDKINPDEAYIPLVIPRVIAPTKYEILLPKKKKSIRKV